MADATVLQEIIDYYVDLLIVQYHDKPKARAHMALLIGESLAAGVYFDVRDGYDIDTAVGVQLDTIGKYVGVDRNYKGIDFGDGFFAFVSYDEATPYSTDKRGFTTYADFETKKGTWLDYPRSLSDTFRLDDASYRIIIKLKIIQNNINHSHESIDSGMFQFFGTTVRADSTGNMEMFYFVPSSLSQVITVALQKDILPRPMGVRLNYILSGDVNYFGFDTYSGASKINSTGFTTYTDYDIKDGQTLNNSKLVEA